MHWLLHCRSNSWSLIYQFQSCLKTELYHRTHVCGFLQNIVLKNLSSSKVARFFVLSLVNTAKDTKDTDGKKEDAKLKINPDELVKVSYIYLIS